MTFVLEPAVVSFSEFLLLLIIAGCSATMAVWSVGELGRVRHALPATVVGMATAVFARLAVELGFAAYPEFAEAIWYEAPELVWLITPMIGTMLGVAGWRAFEVWHEQNMTVAGLFGFDDDEPDPKFRRTGGGHYGIKTQLPPSGFGKKRMPKT